MEISSKESMHELFPLLEVYENCKNKILNNALEWFWTFWKLLSRFIQDNKLKRIEPGTFKGLIYLEKLFLNENMLLKLNEDAFDSSRNSLKELY